MTLVDGYNLLWAFPALREPMKAKRSAAARRGLLEIVARVARSGKLKLPVTVVFDGRPEGDAPPEDVRARFAPRPGGADDLILELLEEAAEPSAATVVTSDRALQERVKRLGARVVGVARFLDQYVPKRFRQPPPRPLRSEKPDGPMGEAEVESWLEEFGLGGEGKDDPGASF